MHAQGVVAGGAGDVKGQNDRRADVVDGQRAGILAAGVFGLEDVVDALDRLIRTGDGGAVTLAL